MSVLEEIKPIIAKAEKTLGTSSVDNPHGVIGALAATVASRDYDIKLLKEDCDRLRKELDECRGEIR